MRTRIKVIGPDHDSYFVCSTSCLLRYSPSLVLIPFTCSRASRLSDPSEPLICLDLYPDTCSEPLPSRDLGTRRMARPLSIHPAVFPTLLLSPQPQTGLTSSTATSVTGFLAQHTPGDEYKQREDETRDQRGHIHTNSSRRHRAAASRGLVSLSLVQVDPCGLGPDVTVQQLHCLH